jgi:hypothetical protein
VRKSVPSNRPQQPSWRLPRRPKDFTTQLLPSFQANRTQGRKEAKRKGIKKQYTNKITGRAELCRVIACVWTPWTLRFLCLGRQLLSLGVAGHMFYSAIFTRLRYRYSPNTNKRAVKDCVQSHGHQEAAPHLRVPVGL